MIKVINMQVQKQQGLSLIELMIALALGAIVIFAAIGNFGSTSAQADIDKEVRALQTLAPLVKQTFGTAQGNYTGLTNAVMLDSSNFPTTMRSGAGEIRHSWRNDGVVLAPLTINSTDDGFTLTYRDVPSDACQDFVGRVYRFFYETAVEGSVVNNLGQINTQCNAANPADIVFTVR